MDDILTPHATALGYCYWHFISQVSGDSDGLTYLFCRIPVWILWLLQTVFVKSENPQFPCVGDPHATLHPFWSIHNIEIDVRILAVCVCCVALSDNPLL